MNKEELLEKMSHDLNEKLHFLIDKPEETTFSTIKALWLKAAGFPVSAEKALNLSLPDLSEKQISNLLQLLQLRIENTPLSHITGRQNFMGIEFISDKRALIPRRETELLGKKALELSINISNSSKKVYVMDVCCGAGNLGLSIAYHNLNSIVFLSDISYDAVELTMENISFLNLNQRIHVQQGDMMSAFEKDEYSEKFDLIICNPPYISSSKVPKMNREISLNEPKIAFDGGLLGIKVIQTLIREAPIYLRNRGWLIFEVGAGQGLFISQLCKKSQLFNKIEPIFDNLNNIRVISAQK